MFARVAVFLFAVLLAAMHPGAALAGGTGDVCIRGGAEDISVTQLTASAGSWDCSARPAALRSAVVAVRLPIPQTEQAPSAFVTRVGMFDKVTLIVENKNGARTQASFTMDDAQPVVGGPFFSLPLPRNTSLAHAYAVFERPGYDAMLLHGYLTSGDARNVTGVARSNMLIAALLGMLLIPVILNVSIYNALREPFIVWHAVLSLCFAMVVYLRSGLVVELSPLSLPAWRSAMVLAMGSAVLAACMFTHAFIEEGRLRPRLRALLPWAGGWSIFISIVHALDFSMFRPLGSTFHAYTLAPVWLFLVWTMIDAIRNGSRTVRFQLLGWSPLLLAFVIQIGTDIIPFVKPDDALNLFYLGALTETVVTTIGIGQRVIRIKREGESAKTRADAMGRLAERDPLTGLLNRRAIDSRFVDLREAGYDTVAIIDLDHFKTINDVNGHATGDYVLQVCGDVLSSDRDNIAVRLGGEEFMLLLRGPMTERRAEKLRRTLSVRIAREVQRLEHIVTASMGLVHLNGDTAATYDLDAVYSRADLLLYQAKNAGRNRTHMANWDTLDRDAEAADMRGVERTVQPPAHAAA